MLCDIIYMFYSCFISQIQKRNITAFCIDVSDEADTEEKAKDFPSHLFLILK